MLYLSEFCCCSRMEPPLIEEEEKEEECVEIPAASASKSFFVYMLESSVSRATYVGATVDVNHRLRQHNGELAGGAHATTMRVKAGETWRRVCYVSGFPDWPAALQFEWRWKQLSRKLLPSPKGKGSRPVLSGSLSRPVDGGSRQRPVDRRLQALEQLLALERPTTKALAYRDWPLGVGPRVHYEAKENYLNQIYNNENYTFEPS